MKFKIKQDPTFSADVSIPRVGGEPIKVPFTFRYRDRNELAAMLERWSEMEEKLAPEEGAKMSVSDATDASIDIAVAKLQDVVAGWEFEEELNEQSLRDLATTCVAVPAEVLKAYFDAFNQSRLGN